jgi:secondary thiamine-phosphate synthase enzyme
MAVETHEIETETKAGTDVVNITDKVEALVRKSKIENGHVVVFVQGSTASVSTMEFEPNLVHDLKNVIGKLVPENAPYRHAKTWGDGNGHSHVRATLMGPSVTIPFEGKRLLLGQWQDIVLIDFDVPSRKRKVFIQITGERTVHSSTK